MCVGGGWGGVEGGWRGGVEGAYSLAFHCLTGAAEGVGRFSRSQHPYWGV